VKQKMFTFIVLINAIENRDDGKDRQTIGYTDDGQHNLCRASEVDPHADKHNCAHADQAKT
jgi:hypothetical protein